MCLHGRWQGISPVFYGEWPEIAFQLSKLISLLIIVGSCLFVAFDIRDMGILLEVR